MWVSRREGGRKHSHVHTRELPLLALVAGSVTTSKGRSPLPRTVGARGRQSGSSGSDGRWVRPCRHWPCGRAAGGGRGSLANGHLALKLTVEMNQRPWKHALSRCLELRRLSSGCQDEIPDWVA